MKKEAIDVRPLVAALNYSTRGKDLSRGRGLILGKNSAIARTFTRNDTMERGSAEMLSLLLTSLYEAPSLPACRDTLVMSITSAALSITLRDTATSSTQETSKTNVSDQFEKFPAGFGNFDFVAHRCGTLDLWRTRSDIPGA